MKLIFKYVSMVLTWTGKLGKLLSSFEQTGKVREFYPQYWKRGEILASFYLFIFFSDFVNDVYLLNKFLYLLNSLNK